ncbi:MAG: transcriptional regulator [Candidatus Woesearchaeota archaeon]
MQTLPQEFEVWYVIPALRRALSIALIDNHKLKQKEVAQLLGVSEAAISQYRTTKRAQQLQFNDKELRTITQYAKKMHTQPQQSHKLFYELTQTLKASMSVCQLHKQLDKSLPAKCTLCNATH